jgi:hypothetical protein
VRIRSCRRLLVVLTPSLLAGSLLLATLGVAQTATPRLNLNLPTYQAPNWNVPLNQNFSTLDFNIPFGPRDRPLLAGSYGINGANSDTTQPFVGLGPAGNVYPDLVTCWDVCTWPALEFNLTATPGTVSLTASSTSVNCSANPGLTTVATADGATIPGSGSAYLVVYTTVAFQVQPLFLPIASVGAGNTGCVILVNPSPVTQATVAYTIWYMGRMTRLGTAVTAKNPLAKGLLFVWAPTPTQYAQFGGLTSNNCHKQSLNGANSCTLPLDFASGTVCNAFTGGGGGLLVGTSDCRTKLAVDIVTRFMAQNGTPLLYQAAGNEMDKCPTDSQTNCDGNAPRSTDGNWNGTAAQLNQWMQDICDQAHSAWPATKCGSFGAESLTINNGYGIYAGCGQTVPIVGAEFMNTVFGADAKLLNSIDAVVAHFYLGYTPQNVDYAINTLVTTCPNIKAAVALKPIWDTETVEGYSSQSSSSIVGITSIACGAGSCVAQLKKQVTGWIGSGQQQQNWLAGIDNVVIYGSTGGCDTSAAGVPITALTTGPDTVTWASANNCAAGANAYAFDVTLNYGYLAWSFLTQSFRRRVHTPGAIDLINPVYGINDTSSTAVQGFPMCIGNNFTLGGGCSLLSLEAQALGEALIWMQTGGLIEPDQSDQCIPKAGSLCPFSGTHLLVGHLWTGQLVEAACYFDPVAHGTNSFPAPSWAQHLITIQGVTSAIPTPGASITLAHAQPVLFVQW